MKRHGYRLFVEILLLLFCSSMVKADNINPHQSPLTEPQLMTSRDVITHSFSNITIQNKTGAAATVYGLYINQFAAAASSSSDCTSPSILYLTYPNILAGGAFVAPVTLTNNQKAPIGKNYLYNMIFSAIYFGNQTNPTMPCTLPGCSWFSPDNSNPNDRWCIYLGLLAPSQGNASTANVPPYGYLVSGPGYNYDLVTNYGYIGPIRCDDRTLTCSVSRPQTVAFPK